ANVQKMRRMISAAASEGSHIVVFPELALTGTREQDIRAASDDVLARAVQELQDAARNTSIAVVFGAPHRSGGELHNAAFVIGADGTLLTRYDQMAVDPAGLFRAGEKPQTMWFRLLGVPAVVTIGR